MKRLIVDLDDTISFNECDDYSLASCNLEVIEKLKYYKKLGYEVVINTSRNMRTYEGNLGKITVNTLPIILEWLRKHDVPHDEVYIGKPWCGTEGFYIDDKAIRPAEFLRMSHEQVQATLSRDKLKPTK